MRALLFVGGLAAGVAAGFVAAHLINSTEGGRRFFADVNERIDGFTGAVRDGYDARTQQLVAAIERGDHDAHRAV